ncbi:MAG: glyoxalase/bleomycin resistance/dioxygenase family protein [Gammaproteobacteria bacterium]|nr:glyoxalase/bleomycin resistance/dioxygenase family protein [Gammaproteobacteria bacterium]
MQIARTGIILTTEGYDDCVAFYRDLFSLPLLFQQQQDDFRLGCLDCNGACPMIETGGHARPAGKTIAQNASKLSFNVTSLKVALQTIRNRGIAAEISVNDRGSTIDLFDADGNRAGIREKPGFAAQIDNRKSLSGRPGEIQ